MRQVREHEAGEAHPPLGNGSTMCPPRVDTPCSTTSAPRESRRLRTDARVHQPEQGNTPACEPNGYHIPVRTGGTPCELSFSQQRLWFIDRLEPGSPVYNVPRAFRLKGSLSIDALTSALDLLVSRHQVLRTIFFDEQGHPWQKVRSAQDVDLMEVDFSKADNPEREAIGYARKVARRSFDLSNDQLIRVVLIRTSEFEHILVLVTHHIIVDRWSMSILASELASAYNAALRLERANLPPIKIQYTDYAAWQHEGAIHGNMASALDYWKTKLGGDVPVLRLPTDRPRPAIQSFEGDSFSFTLPEDVSSAIRLMARNLRSTPFVILVSSFKSLLFRYTGETDLLVGTPVAGRTHREVESVVGLFTNTVALRTDLSGNPTFLDLVQQVQKTVLEALTYQETPFERIIEELQPGRELSYSPLFQVWFSYANTPPEEFQFDGLDVKELEIDTRTTKFDLSLHIRPHTTGRLDCVFEYSRALFDAETIERIARHFGVLLEGAVAEPSLRLSDLPIMTASERHQVLYGWNQTKATYPSESTLVDLVQDQVFRTPARIAVVGGGRQLTYAEFWALVERVSTSLTRRGVGPGDRVGVMMERCPDLVVTLAAVLHAGAAYVPLDPSYPVERLRQMAEDAGIRLIITGPGLSITGQTLLPIGQALADAPNGRARDHRLPSADDLAYVIFTSGSTGRPKGSMNTHRAVVNRLWWMQEAFHLDASDVVLQKTPYSFDVSVWEFFWPLIVGARLAVAEPGIHRDPQALTATMKREAITTLHFVPYMLGSFLEADLTACRTLRRVICSGEELPPTLVNRFYERTSDAHVNPELHNLYGPTECAVDVSHQPCRPGMTVVPIGKPIANTRLYVLDSARQPVPIGIPGELYIGGVQVGAGYVGREDLTHERFLEDPFAPPPFAGEPVPRLYRTGDLARWLPDGTIEYLGRIDTQIKIRGNRIELGEIETVLREHPALSDAVAMAYEASPGDVRLAAYVSSRTELPVPAPFLQAYLRERLPEYMVPTVFVPLDAFPLTPSGKIDRKRLPVPVVAREAVSSGIPTTDTERILAEIWKQVLGLASIDTADNFFDLGGHSLLVTRVLAQIQQHLGKNLPVLALFRHPTIASLAKALESDDITTRSFDAIRERARRQRAAIVRPQNQSGDR